MKRNDAILRLALRDKNKIPADDHEKIGETNLQESGELSDFDIIDNPETKKIYVDKPQCILARANQDFIADPEAESDKDITISNSAANNTEAIPSISSIEVRDQSSQQIGNPIIDEFDDSTDSSSDTERTSSSDSSSSTLNEDSDDSVKDPDFEMEQRRSIEVSDDSETKDNIGNEANFEATSTAISSGSAVDELPSLNSNSDDTSIPDTKKRSRKCVAEPTEWLQNKCKILRNAGSAYVTLKTKVQKDARKIKPPCSERCRLKCREKFSAVDRQAVFKEFWELKDITCKRDFISRQRKYRRYTTTQKGRQLNNAFYLTKMGCQIQICKTFFLNTLDINNKVIQTVVKKRTSAGSVEEDKRGKHLSHHKLPDCVKESIRKHINSIPRIESHYLRQQTEREFIEAGKVIADLHRKYVEECERNSEPHSIYVMYAKIFNTEFNLGFCAKKGSL